MVAKEREVDAFMLSKMLGKLCKGIEDGAGVGPKAVVY